MTRARGLRRPTPPAQIYRVAGPAAQDLVIRALPAINPRALRVTGGRHESEWFVIVEARSPAILDAAHVMVRALTPSSFLLEDIGQELPDDTSSLEPA